MLGRTSEVGLVRRWYVLKVVLVMMMMEVRSKVYIYVCCLNDLAYRTATTF
jgi:hypothetical protein